MTLYLLIYLFIFLSASLLACLSIHPSIYLPSHLTISLPSSLPKQFINPTFYPVMCIYIFTGYTMKINNLITGINMQDTPCSIQKSSLPSYLTNMVYTQSGSQHSVRLSPLSCDKNTVVVAAACLLLLLTTTFFPLQSNKRNNHSLTHYIKI